MGLLSLELTKAAAGEANVSMYAGSLTNRIQKEGPATQGHRLLSYQAFCREVVLPKIAAEGDSTMNVGDSLKLDLRQRLELPLKDKQTLASQLGVPVSAIDRLWESTSTNEQRTVTQVAQDVRTRVTDYKFLLEHWNKYTPPPAGQERKTNALQALQVGDITKAWELYLELLPRPPGLPGPPGNLKVVGP